MATKSKAQVRVLKLLRDGYIMDRHGKYGLAGRLVRRQGEGVTVSEKTVSVLYAAGYIGIRTDGIADWKITPAGVEAIANAR